MRRKPSTCALSAVSVWDRVDPALYRTSWGSVGGSWCGLGGRHWALAGTHATGDKQRSCPFLFTGRFKVTLKLSVGF